jgi:hypothetical protein
MAGLPRLSRPVDSRVAPTSTGQLTHFVPACTKELLMKCTRQRCQVAFWPLAAAALMLSLLSPIPDLRAPVGRVQADVFT